MLHRIISNYIHTYIIVKCIQIIVVFNTLPFCNINAILSSSNVTLFTHVDFSLPINTLYYPMYQNIVSNLILYYDFLPGLYLSPKSWIFVAVTLICMNCICRKKFLQSCYWNMLLFCVSICKHMYRNRDVHFNRSKCSSNG